MAILICTGNAGKLKEFSRALGPSEGVLNTSILNDSAQVKYEEPLEDSDYFISNAAIKLMNAFKFVAENNFKQIHKIIVDDSGLCVPALNYLPGVHSAHFAGEEKSVEKNNLLLQKMIEESSLVHEFKDEKRLHAFFVCFLLSIEINWNCDLSFFKNISFHKASNLKFTSSKFLEFMSNLEHQCLNKVNLNSIGGGLRETFPASHLFEQIPEGIFVTLNFGYCCGEVSNKSQNNIPGEGHGYDPLFYSMKENLRELSFASIPLEEKNKISHRAWAKNYLLQSL